MNTNVFILPLKSSRSRGNVNSLSITRRTGCLPYQFRVDKEGLSSNAVRRPTNIASCSARFLCTSMLVSGLDSLIGFPPVRFISMKPSVDSAHFKVMYGRLSVLNVMKRLISAGIPPLIHLQLLQYRLCAVFRYLCRLPEKTGPCSLSRLWGFSSL